MVGDALQQDECAQQRDGEAVPIPARLPFLDQHRSAGLLAERIEVPGESRDVDVLPTPRSPNRMQCMPGWLTASAILSSRSDRPENRSALWIGVAGVNTVPS